jgi:zinc/manganese transport system substrate-binding protein
MIFSFLLFALGSSLSYGKLNVVASTPEVGWLVHRIGGERVNVRVLAPAGVNYHFAEARPDYVLALSRADVLCRVGAELEDAWLLKAVERAANSKVMEGQKGDCVLASTVDMEKPTKKLDRTQGDVHGSGNPHFYMAPLAMSNAGNSVEQALSRAAPEHAKEFAERNEKTSSLLKAIHSDGLKRLASLKDKMFLEYHKDFTYFMREYSLNSMGSIEEVPGVSPSAARLALVAKRAMDSKAVLAIASNHDPISLLLKFQQLSQVPFVQVPTSLSSPSEENSFRLWQEGIWNQMLSKLK